VLWFIEEPGDDGEIRMAEAGRLVVPGDSPLRETLELLLEGPNKTERDRRLMSLIPSGTEIASVSMSGSTAVVGISEAFADNRFGNEGLWIRIKQIVYTATQFRNVASVRIELKRKGSGGAWSPSPLGDVIGDGIYLGKAFTRADLP
jgi:spore germination protein GerM